jgi:DNA-binding XRE family transcriptional regulator
MEILTIIMAARRIPLEKPPTKAEAARVDRMQKAMLLRIGTRLKRMRTESGLSLRAFAMKADCSPTYLSEIERGDRSISVEFLVRAARHLHPRRRRNLVLTSKSPLTIAVQSVHSSETYSDGRQTCKSISAGFGFKADLRPRRAAPGNRWATALEAPPPGLSNGE